VSQATSLLHRTLAARAGEPPHPALVLLHGRGSHELDLLTLAPELDPRLFVISARAPLPWEGGIGYAWYHLEAPARANKETFADSLRLLQRFLGELAAAYPVDPGRVYLLGFSQGAMMANALTLAEPHRVAGAILLSGFQPDLDGFTPNPDGVRSKPFFVGHGVHDELLGIELGRAVRDTLTNLGADLTYHEYEMGHQIIPQELVDIDSWLEATIAARGGPSD
jgi:phospholipase/carboxylesterase